MDAYIKLGIVAFLPVVVTVIFYLLDKKTKFKNIDGKIKQTIYGITFGLLAVLGTEWSIPLEGAGLNCRDAAVLTAGFFFGAPAGIIAGLIGGIERWFATLWGVGTFTRVACSISTILAGFYAAALRKFMFENKKPGYLISAAAGITMETFHLTMVFLTNMDSPNEAMRNIQVCAVPMIIANGLSVMLSAMALSLLSGPKKEFIENRKKRISQTIQKWLLVAIATAFAATSFFVFRLQNALASAQGDKLLTMALDEVEADIKDTSNANLISIAEKIVIELDEGSSSLSEIAKKNDISEINIIDENGIITSSTSPEYIGYDMHDGAQSSEFLCLLEGKNEFAQDYGPISLDQSISRKYAGIKYGNGFVQVGYDAIQFQKDISLDIIGITKNRHVGESGFILIIDEQYDIVSAPEFLNISTLKEDAEKNELPGEDITFTAPLSGEECWVRYRSSEGYHIVSILPEDEVLHMRNIALYVNSFIEILVFAVLFGLIYMLIKYVVVDRIKCFNLSLSKITNGNLDEVVNVRSSEEFASLSDDINMTVDTLKHYIDDASRRIDQELEFAKNIQRSALPSIFPAFPKRKDMDIFASMDPAKEVGGDFYDFYLTKNDTLNFLIADVSGKGIPAAMFMMRAKTELKSLTESELGLSDVFTRGNEKLCEGNDAGMFVTVWQGCIDLITGILTYANAGHNPPLIKHQDGLFEFLPAKPGFVMAGMEGLRYKTQEVILEPGDIIYLYTDGVTEATNSSQELYGNDRLLNTINNAKYESMSDLCAYIKSDVQKFVGNAPQFDDITMVAFHYIGQPEVPTIHFDEAKLDDITSVTDFIDSELEKISCPQKTIIQINIAIDEIYSNIVRYGYQNKVGPVTVKLIHKEDPRSIFIRFSDEGIPYNPITATDPDITLSADERKIGGLGIFMVKKTMDDIKYKYEKGENVLTIEKRF